MGGWQDDGGPGLANSLRTHPRGLGDYAGPPFQARRRETGHTRISRPAVGQNLHVFIGITARFDKGERGDWVPPRQKR